VKIVVVGAGIFGITAALELRRRGHAVSLCDPGPLPHPHAESTDISKVVRMDYADELYMDWMEETFSSWLAWNARWGEELYHEVGFLVLARDEMSPGGFEHTCFTALQSRGHTVVRVDAAEIGRRFQPWSAGGYRDGYFNPRAGWAESGRVVARLVREARDGGVELREGTQVAALAEGEARIRGVVLSGGEVLSADAVLVAAGAWTPVLLPHLRDRLWATAQTVFHFRVAEPAAYQPPRFPVWAAGIGDDGWYGFPALADGTVKVANHGVGRPLHPDAERLVAAADEAHFRSFLQRALPALADAAVVASRLCLYSDSFDGDFLIDHDPERPGLVVACGGSGHGFKFAPALGATIADVVERRPNPRAPRFRWRAATDERAHRK